MIKTFTLLFKDFKINILFCVLVQRHPYRELFAIFHTYCRVLFLCLKKHFLVIDALHVVCLYCQLIMQIYILFSSKLINVITSVIDV